MLKQILKAGYVDPELLESLTEEQKDIIFRKLREEQVKKWSEREALIAETPDSNPLKPERKRKINFKIAKDGNPWVWVMGEHHNDLSYEEMILKREREEEELEKERLRKEAEELAKHETRDILLAPVEKLEVNPQSFARTESVLDSQNGLMSTSKSMQLWQKAVGNRAQLVRRMSASEKNDYEKRRADEIYESMLYSEQVKKKRVADVVMEYMQRWKENEVAAKMHEQQKRENFLKLKRMQTDSSTVEKALEMLPEDKKKAFQRKISQQYLRRSDSVSSNSPSNTPTRRPKKLGAAHFKLYRQASFADEPETRPKTMEHAIKWFQSNEIPKGVGKDLDGIISMWFHGSISKSEAERLLTPKPPGMFLLRISNKVWGYSVSIRTSEKVKHYVLLATEGKYRFVGNNQPEFKTLPELLKYYKYNPITWTGQEVMLLPCAQTDENFREIKALFEDEQGTAM